MSFDRVLIDHNYTIGNELTVNEFMSNWTLQSGYPVIYISKNDTTNTFLVTQVNIKIKFLFRCNVSLNLVKSTKRFCHILFLLINMKNK